LAAIGDAFAGGGVIAGPAAPELGFTVGFSTVLFESEVVVIA
jgi:hypothetical protein